jgi:putative copper export protein
VWDRLYPYFDWIEKTWLGHAIRESKWTFTLAEVFHLFGITLFLGAILVLALRLFDLVLREKGVAETARELMPWSMSGLAVTLVTGTLLFTSEAVKCWGNVAFHYKVLFLLLALPFQFTALRSITRADRQGLPPIVRKLTALVAVVLWFGVAVFGRAIFFF